MKKFIAALLSVALLNFPVLPIHAESKLLAFPGAEGGGKYTEGARAASSVSVYHVTNLNASGSGSFADAVSKSGRIIVFDVGGTIELNGTLSISKSNLTILGQTAPGEGITFSGGDILLSNGVENIIMRHIRIRPTDKNGGEPDGLGGRWNKNIIIDHCSVSWSVDELLTLYAGSSESSLEVGNHLTVQNTIASESLRMSNHFKGAHGYGGIFGGTYATYHHNLLAHHDSRSPRLDREILSTELKNNVIYDWGLTNSVYGAEPYSYNSVTFTPSNVNFISNYYKYGPGTKKSIRSKLFEVTNDQTASYSNFYFNGNYVWGSDSVTANNLSGVTNSSRAVFLTEPVDMGEYTIPDQSAEDAYNEVLKNVGATLPKRDAIDARIIADVKNSTGRIVNNADEVSGLIPVVPVYETFEIPSDWKEENNMGSYSETDIVPSGEHAGYTWIEAYVNDWTQDQELPTNPDIIVKSPAISSLNSTVNDIEVDNGDWTVISEDETLFYNAVTSQNGSYQVTKMELYDANTLISSYDTNYISDNITLTPGTHYLTCRAYNSKGEQTQSPTSIVYVKSTNNAGSYTYTQIGTPSSFDGKGGAWLASDGTYTVAGAGKLGSGKNDSCGFMYKEVTGDFDVTVKMASIPKFENGQVSGLMIRESLDTNSRMAMIADGWLKYGENLRVFTRSSANSNVSTTYFSNSIGSAITNTSSYVTTSAEYALPSYMRITRSGDTLTMSVSDSGTSWTDNARQPMTVEISDLADTLYVGIATDSCQGTALKENLALASYSHLYLNGESDYDYSQTPRPYLYSEGTTVKASSEEDSILAVAGYDENGRLTSVNLKNANAYAIATANVIYADSMKVFYWNSLHSPIFASCEYTNNYRVSRNVAENEAVEMFGMTMLTDMTYSSFSSPLTCNGKSFDGYIKTSASVNGRYRNGVGTGSCFKYVAPFSGKLTAYFYNVGNTKYAYITEENTSDYENNSLAKHQGTGEKSVVSLSADVTAGKTYYIYVAGSKGCFCGFDFEISE